MKPKKIPMRRCVGCMEQSPKKELIRVVKNNEGEVNLDLTGKMNGRGAYLHRNQACLQLAFKKRSIQRALEIELTDELKEKIEAQLNE